MANEYRKLPESTVAIDQNPYNGTWEVGWLYDDGEFVSYSCGHTKEEAEAMIPRFDEILERDEAKRKAEQAETESWQNETWPNVAHVRTKIKAMRNPLKALDESFKLDMLIDMDLSEHISWPLPSWKAIKSGRIYGR